jgi:hypothetical protein
MKKPGEEPGFLLSRCAMNDAILDPLESPLTQTDDDPGRVSEVVIRLT